MAKQKSSKTRPTARAVDTPGRTVASDWSRPALADSAIRDLMGAVGIDEEAAKRMLATAMKGANAYAREKIPPNGALLMSLLEFMAIAHMSQKQFQDVVSFMGQWGPVTYDILGRYADRQWESIEQRVQTQGVIVPARAHASH